ncbi:MAG: hypothetical protein H0V97_06380 [Actinobacteria bacterium]|nr:hypothetical protein [Actinomycetota bacterium]
MASYYLTSPNVFNQKFAALDHRAQLVYLYITSCRHRNSEGLFFLPMPYVANDLGMSTEDVEAARQHLETEAFIAYDDGSEVILDRKALEFYQPVGQKQLLGAVRALQGVPKSPLKAELLKLAFHNAPDLADAIVEKCGELAGQVFPKGYPGSSQTADTPSQTEEATT